MKFWPDGGAVTKMMPMKVTYTNLNTSRKKYRSYLNVPPHKSLVISIWFQPDILINTFHLLDAFIIGWLFSLPEQEVR